MNFHLNKAKLQRINPQFSSWKMQRDSRLCATISNVSHIPIVLGSSKFVSFWHSTCEDDFSLLLWRGKFHADDERDRKRDEKRWQKNNILGFHPRVHYKWSNRKNNNVVNVKNVCTIVVYYFFLVDSSFRRWEFFSSFPPPVCRCSQFFILFCGSSLFLSYFHVLFSAVRQYCFGGFSLIFISHGCIDDSVWM